MSHLGGCATLCLKLIHITSPPGTFDPLMIFSITGTFPGSVPALPETAPLTKTNSPNYRFNFHFCSPTDFYCTFFKCFFLSLTFIFPIVSARTIFIRKTPQQQFCFPPPWSHLGISHFLPIFKGHSSLHFHIIPKQPLSHLFSA